MIEHFYVVNVLRPQWSPKTKHEIIEKMYSPPESDL